MPWKPLFLSALQVIPQLGKESMNESASASCWPVTSSSRWKPNSGCCYNRRGNGTYTDRSALQCRWRLSPRGLRILTFLHSLSDWLCLEPRDDRDSKRTKAGARPQQTRCSAAQPPALHRLWTGFASNDHRRSTARPAGNCSARRLQIAGSSNSGTSRPRL